MLSKNIIYCFVFLFICTISCNSYSDEDYNEVDNIIIHSNFNINVIDSLYKTGFDKDYLDALNLISIAIDTNSKLYKGNSYSTKSDNATKLYYLCDSYALFIVLRNNIEKYLDKDDLLYNIEIKNTDGLYVKEILTEMNYINDFESDDEIVNKWKLLFLSDMANFIEQYEISLEFLDIYYEEFIPNDLYFSLKIDNLIQLGEIYPAKDEFDKFNKDYYKYKEYKDFFENW